MRLPAPPLLLVTDRAQAHRPVADIVAAACAAGCRWISVREKDLPVGEQISLARTLLPIARAHGARLTLHGDPRTAQAAGVDGVHLSAGAAAAAARAELGLGALVGVSVHAAADLAQAAEADYVIAGPAYETASKPGYGPALGVSGVAALARAAPVPLIAIGGISPANALLLLQSGARGIAVMGSVMRATDPGAQVKALLSAVAGARRR